MEKEINKTINKEIDKAYKDFIKAKDRFTNNYEISLRKHLPNYEQKRKEAIRFNFDMCNDEPSIYIDEIDILSHIQWMLENEDEYESM